jgi:hypothetical protein
MDNEELVDQPILPEPSPKRVSIKTVIVGIIIFLVGVTGAYYMGKNANKEIATQTLITPSVIQATPILHQTQEWKTYENLFYDFSFKYPANLFPRKDSSYISMGFLENPNDNSSQKLTVQVMPNPPESFIKQFTEDNVEIGVDFQRTYERTKINNYPAIIVKSINQCMGTFESCKATPNKTFYSAAILYQGKYITFEYYNQQAEGQTQDDLNYLKKLASTFSAIKDQGIPPLSEWKTYKSPQNYSFQYPPQLEIISGGNFDVQLKGENILISLMVLGTDKSITEYIDEKANGPYKSFSKEQIELGYVHASLAKGEFQDGNLMRDYVLSIGVGKILDVQSRPKDEKAIALIDKIVSTIQLVPPPKEKLN